MEKYTFNFTYGELITIQDALSDFRSDLSELQKEQFDRYRAQYIEDIEAVEDILTIK